MDLSTALAIGTRLFQLADRLINTPRDKGALREYEALRTEHRRHVVAEANALVEPAGDDLAHGTVADNRDNNLEEFRENFDVDHSTKEETVAGQTIYRDEGQAEDDDNDVDVDDPAYKTEDQIQEVLADEGEALSVEEDERRLEEELSDEADRDNENASDDDDNPYDAVQEDLADRNDEDEEGKD
jgi:hypothetical protein